MSEDRRARWDERHAAAEGPGTPAAVLVRNRHLLPPLGAALDLACGRGASALWLAEQGLDTTAWDYSKVAIERLAAEAAARRLSVRTAVRDVTRDPPVPASFDVIVVSFFLERALMPALVAALRPGGRLFYQTFTQEGAEGPGPQDPRFRLAPNELLRLLGGLRLRYYREDGAALGPDQLQGIALLVGERAAPGGIKAVPRSGR